MLIFDSETLAVINSLTVDTFYLYELWFDESQPPLRLTTLNSEFTFNGDVYSPAAIKQSEIASNTDGSVSDITVTVGDAAGVIQYYSENYKLAGKSLVVRQLFRGAMSFSEYSYVIKGTMFRDYQAIITCGLGFDVFLMQVPSRTIRRNFCRWRFRSAECAYSGTDSTCSMQFSDCRRKGNTPNFGGFPGIITNRVYV